MSEPVVPPPPPQVGDVIELRIGDKTYKQVVIDPGGATNPRAWTLVVEPLDES